MQAWTRKGVQQHDGQFSDYILNKRWVDRARRDHYGPAMLGTALVLDGLRTGRRNVVLAGLKAVAWAADHPWKKDGGEALGVVFEDMALSVGYDDSYAQLANDATYAPYVSRWVRRLKRITYHLYPAVASPRPGATTTTGSSSKDSLSRRSGTCPGPTVRTCRPIARTRYSPTPTPT